MDVKTWIADLPSVEAVRPGRCPRCEEASRPVGGALMLHGHGIRPRLLRGPVAPEGNPEELEILLRRYLCQSCDAVIAVGPAGIVPGRLYSAMAIALALWLYGVARSSHPEVRRRVSPWRSSARDPARTLWITLVRWVEARRQGVLFSRLRSLRSSAPRRLVASQAAQAIAALALMTSPSWGERVFAGAIRA